jgi:peptidoglycan/xylan/chitin deacetylase (PgdA/CDA1 family)
MVTDGCPAHTAHLGPHKTPAQFEADLRWLKARYEVINYRQLCERRAASDSRGPALGSSTLALSDLATFRFSSRPAAILTFDDGLREHLAVVAPLLQKHELPAIFFITTGFLDNRRLFYRHKVSLCLEAARGCAEPQLAEVLREIGSEVRSRRSEVSDQSTKTAEIPPSALRFPHPVAGSPHAARAPD